MSGFRRFNMRNRRWNFPAAPRRGRFRLPRWADYLLTGAICLLLLVFVTRIERVSSVSNEGRARVNDGDTITLAGNRIRLQGIDAPELQQSCTRDGADYACGREAMAALQALVRGSDLRCEGWERDQYDRLLAVCSTGNSAESINAAMVRAGWAVSFGAYQAEERVARAANSGMWQGEFQRPRDWRQAHRRHDLDQKHDWWATVRNWFRQLAWP